jgi:hypothetical protein
MNVIALVDGSSGSDVSDGYAPSEHGWTAGTRLMFVEPFADASARIVSREIAVDPFSDLGKLLAEGAGELNMGDPKVLNAALKYVQENIHSEKLMVDLWDHGNAWMSASLDDESSDDLIPHTGELAQGLEGVDIDVLAFDACQMASKEVVDIIARDSVAPLVVASEHNIPGTGFEYEDVLKRAERLFSDGEVTPKELAHALVDSFATSSEQNVSLSATDVTRLPEVDAKLSALVDALEAAGGLENKNVRKAYRGAHRVHRDRNQMDIGDFAAQLAGRFETGPIHEAAVELSRAAYDAVYLGRQMLNEDSEGTTGLTIYAPLRDDLSFLEYTENSDTPWADSPWTSFILGPSGPRYLEETQDEGT